MIRSDGVRMLTVGEYAEKHNCSSKTVWHWCKTGRLQGAIKEPNEGGAYAGFKFRIPEDAEPFPPKRVYERKAPPKPKPRVAPAPKKLNTDHDKSMYIRNHRGTKSIRELARETGLTTEEVRRRYERLFECGDGCGDSMITPKCKVCPIYGMGWCEYDFQTDQLMPHDPENCPALMDADKQGGMQIARTDTEGEKEAAAPGENLSEKVCFHEASL